MRYLVLLTLSFLISYASAQNNVIDKIVAVVGEEIILKSEIENQLIHLRSENILDPQIDYKTQVLEQLLVNKLLLAQAKVDSVVVTDEDVERELNARIDSYINQIGSQARMESYFGKSIEELKNEMRTVVKEGAITSEMQQKIVKDVRVTPSEVRYYYKKLNKDSIRDVGAQYEIQQIVIRPKISDSEKERIRNQLREFRDEVLSGKQSFTVLAGLYSQDPVSASKGGELGYIAKSQLAPEFAEAAFALKPGKLSKIVETEYGFHLIQGIDRQGDKVNVRHILLRPRIEDSQRQEAIQRMDSIVKYIQRDSVPFEYVAEMRSDDKNTRNNYGLIVDEDANPKLPLEIIKGEMAKQVKNLQVGEISEPFWDQSGPIEEYKIIKIKAYYPTHKANLQDDWSFFENNLLIEKRQKTFQKWIKEKQESTYIHIDDEYKNAKFNFDGWIK